MKTVASDVPPTGTFSIGTGKASTKVEARSSATRPARVAADGSYAASDASAENAGERAGEDDRSDDGEEARGFAGYPDRPLRLRAGFRD